MARKLTLEELNTTLDGVISQCNDRIAKFKKNLDENPVYAFQWGTDALAASATLRVVEEAKHYANLDNEVDGVKPSWEERLENLRQYYTRQLLNLADQVPSSTSQMSNMVDNYRRSAHARLVNTLNGEYFAGF